MRSTASCESSGIRGTNSLQRRRGVASFPSWSLQRDHAAVQARRRGARRRARIAWRPARLRDRRARRARRPSTSHSTAPGDRSSSRARSGRVPRLRATLTCHVRHCAPPLRIARRQLPEHRPTARRRRGRRRLGRDSAKRSAPRAAPAASFAAA
jgi:hypothetical protein